MGARQTAYVTLFLLFTTACSRVDNSAHVEAIQKTLGRTPDWVERSAHGKRLWVIERSFYESRGYMPAWIDGDRSTPHLEDLIQQFRNSELHGLDSAAEAGPLMDAVRYQPQLSWSEPTPVDDKEVISGLIGIFLGTGSIVIVTLGLGLAFGVARLLLASTLPGRVFDKSVENEQIFLNLQNPK